MTKITSIEGIGETYAKKLTDAGVASLEDLLAKAGAAKGRQALAAQTGINETLILKWVNRADLFRINGIGEQMSDLLEFSGVDSVPELAQRKAENLMQKISEINEAKKLVNRLPSLAQVSDWIEQARKMEKVVTH